MRHGFKTVFIVVVLVFSITRPTQAGIAPIVLTSASYNQDVVVENTAPAPVIPGGYTTASMDNGIGNTGNSWYEEGYDSAAPGTGLPKAGSTFTSQSSSVHRYTMAPSYKTNNAVMLDSTLTSATLTLAVPTACSQLSFLESGGNNGVSFNYVVHHENGAADTGSVSIIDWFSAGAIAWTANGRVDVGTFAFNNVNNNYPRLFTLDITLGNAGSPVTTIDFAYASGGGHGAIMAVSGGSSGTFSPLTVAGYNEDIVVEASAGSPGALSGYTTATMDTGLANSMNTWYEAGYDPDAPLTGLPSAGSTITNISAPDHLYTLASSYSDNDVLLLSSNAPTGTLTFADPAVEQNLSFLCSAGNGPVTVNYAIQHTSGSPQTGSFVVQDWFSYCPVAYFANGRVDIDNKTVNNVSAGNPCLYAVDVALSNTSTPVSSVMLTWASGAYDGNVAFFALSGGASSLALAGDDFNTNSAAAASILQQWYNSSGLYNSTGWWNAANCLEALETVAAADDQRQYLGVLSNTFNLNAGGNFLDGYYDDEGWWANAWIRGYDLTGNTNFLNMAKTIFADMTNGWSPANCNGGVWWDKSETYKNAIANELFMLSAIRLHQRTPGDNGAGSYFYWATNEWAWFQSSGMINSKNLVNDGLTNCVNNNGSTFTYNQGVLIGALTDLYKVTGETSYLTEATDIAHSVIANLADANDVLIEASPCDPTCGGGDVPEFKGICIRYIAYLYDVTRDAVCYSFLYNSAHALWLNDRTILSISLECRGRDLSTARTRHAKVQLSWPSPHLRNRSRPTSSLSKDRAIRLSAMPLAAPPAR
jgi:predicted alpha-1,6-mannanase (GH76 family)